MIKRYTVEGDLGYDDDSNQPYAVLECKEEEDGEYCMFSDVENLMQENIKLKSQLTILRIELAHLKAKDSRLVFGEENANNKR